MARILVVDDEADVSEFIKDALALGGHSAETASSGAAALELARSKRYDIVILDRNMPGMSGLEVVTALRRLPEAKGVKILMCTASGMMGDVDDALSAGADDYIVKPIEMKRLLDKISRLAPKPGAAPESESGGTKGILGRLFPPRS